MNDLEIAGYLDRGLSAPDRTRVEDHLADCSECRENVAATQHVIAGLKRPRRIGTIAGLLAIAAVGLIVISPQLTRTRQPLEVVSRDAGGASALAAYEPVVAAGGGSPIRFAWASAPDAVSYRFTLSSADGTTVWSFTGTDTTVALPANVTLTPGTDYVWFADAILTDGSTRTTGLKPLHFRP